MPGDIFSGKNLPFLDANNGGSGVAIGDTLQKAHDGIKNVDTIITGHSAQMTWGDLEEYISFNREFLNDVRAAKRPARPWPTWRARGRYRPSTPATRRRGPIG